MPAYLQNVAFGCADPYLLAQFWSQLVGHPLHSDDQPGDPVATIDVPVGYTLYFERVPEPKVGKNRLHLCLRPDTTRDAEIDRLLALGATMVDDRRAIPEDGGWAVLADPEGNEFCLLRARGD